jgi:hypothetical protein
MVITMLLQPVHLRSTDAAQKDQTLIFAAQTTVQILEHDAWL